MSFCMAGVALRDVLTCLQTCRKFLLCDRCDTFARFSTDELHLSWQAQHSGDLHRHFAWQVQHFRRVALRALHSTLSTLHTLHSTLYTPRSTLYTPHSTLYTLHPSLYTPHVTLYTLYSTLRTLLSTLYTQHFTLRTLHSTLCTPPSSAFHSLQRTGNRGKNVQDCSHNLFHKSVLHDLLRVRGLHLVFLPQLLQRIQNVARACTPKIMDLAAGEKIKYSRHPWCAEQSGTVCHIFWNLSDEQVFGSSSFIYFLLPDLHCFALKCVVFGIRLSGGEMQVSKMCKKDLEFSKRDSL